MTFVMVLPLFLFGCNTDEKRNLYFIDASFDAQNNTLSCQQRVEYVNNSENALSEVCFFLYANAFAEGQKTVSTSYETKAYPNGKSYGNITFSSVKTGGKDAQFSVDETDGSILTINLEKELFPSESVSILMDYTVQLANIRHRLGYGNDTINFGNFFPIACVYEENGFVRNKFAANGDPFYSEVSDFAVKISYPNNFTIASSGVHSIEFSDETCLATCKAEKVRDFCFVLSEKFEKNTAKAGDVEVNYFFYDDEGAQKHLETAVKAVQTFEKLFGKYPYAQLSVVKADFCFGGMEYPNLVLIADDLANDETIDYVIVHEIAHQWWYGLVGNNEYSDAWVDEGLTEFSTALFFEENPDYGMEYETIMQNATDTYQNFVKIYSTITGSCDESMNRNLSQFATEPEYVNCTYTKGMLLFDCIRKTMSQRKFFNCLRQYFKDFCFRNSSAEKLIESFSKTSHINLESFFKAWLEGTVKLGA